MKLTKKKDHDTLIEGCILFKNSDFLGKIGPKSYSVYERVLKNLIEENIFINGIVRKTNIKLGILFSITSRLTGVRGVAGKSV